MAALLKGRLILCMISKFFIVISAFNSFLSIFTGFAHTLALHQRLRIWKF